MISRLKQLLTRPTLIAATLSLVFCGGRFEPGRPPNILLLSLDTLRAQNLGCYGYEHQTSPFLDRLASEGVRFEHSFVNTLATPPSHASLLTSTYQETHRFFYSTNSLSDESYDRVPESLVMVQEILREAGYSTIAVTGGGYMSQHFGFERGFDVYLDDGEGLEVQSSQLLDVLNGMGTAQKPTFVFLHTYETHFPYVSPAGYAERFGGAMIELGLNANLYNKVQADISELDPQELRSLVAMYDGNIFHADMLLKNLFTKLQDSGFLDHCVVIITSDHGEEFGEHDHLNHLGYLYDELIKVPLIIWGTVDAFSANTDRLVSSIDIAPTVLGIANLPPSAQFQGVDLLAEAPHRDRDDAVFSQFGDIRASIRTAQWKLIEDNRQTTFELYDMMGDPRERNNLILTHPEIARGLKKRLLEWKRTVPKAPSKRNDMSKPDLRTLERLRSLGYIK